MHYLRSDGSTLEQIDYGYDAGGRIRTRSMLHASSLRDSPMRASYDAANRLLRVTAHGHSLKKQATPDAAFRSIRSHVKLLDKDFLFKSPASGQIKLSKHLPAVKLQASIAKKAVSSHVVSDGNLLPLG